jgi:hypothetical protein
MSFESFWQAYPRKVGRLKAERCWRRMTDRDRYDAMIGLELWKQTVQWTSAEGMFIPYASTFLGQERWKDEPWNGAFNERFDDR